jgi:hypothetical protein
MGALGLGKFLGASAKLQEATLKKQIPLIQHFYNANRIMKIVDEDMGAKYLELNTPKLDQNGFYDYEINQNGEAVPMLENRLDVGKYDLSYREMDKPFTNTSERYRQDVELMKLLAQVKPQYVELLLPYLLKDSHSSIADKISMVIESMQGQNDPNSDMAMQIEMAKKQLELEEMRSKIDLNRSKATNTKSQHLVDMEKVAQNERNNMRSTEAKNSQALLKALMGG